MYFGPHSYTMTKSSAILFILLFSLLFKLEEAVRVLHNASGREKVRRRETSKYMKNAVMWVNLKEERCLSLFISGSL